MKHIIFDCDSTVGIPGYPMDDALALLYLLGRPAEMNGGWQDFRLRNCR